MHDGALGGVTAEPTPWATIWLERDGACGPDGGVNSQLCSVNCAAPEIVPFCSRERGGDMLQDVYS